MCSNTNTVWSCYADVMLGGNNKDDVTAKMERSILQLPNNVVFKGTDMLNWETAVCVGDISC